MIPLEFTLGMASGLAVAGALYLGLWWWARRTSADVSPPEGALGFNRRARGEPERLEPRSTPATVSAELHPAPAPSPGSLLPTDRATAPGGSRPARRAAAPPASGAPTEAVRLSQRVILHVYAQGDLPFGAVAPFGLCQAGIGEALGVTQGGLAAVLRRLQAAGILTAERGHVRGRDRRLKIYRLSTRGVALARELRARVAWLPDGRRSGPTGVARASAPVLRPVRSPRAPV
jgi:DNA-binding MarR family transcriptional regulator